jgi:predicted nucleic acid binding AN1-type Zn finger protein
MMHYNSYSGFITTYNLYLIYKVLYCQGLFPDERTVKPSNIMNSGRGSRVEADSPRKVFRLKELSSRDRMFGYEIR